MTAPVVITSPHNPVVQGWRGLNRSRKARMAAGAFIAEGEHMAQEAMKAGRATALLCCDALLDRYQALTAAAEAAGLPVFILSERALEAVADTKTPQGVLCICGLPETDSLPDLPLVVALENVQDPGNVGTILRTMDAIGSAGVLLSRECADVFAPKTLRATMGAVFRVPIRIADDFHGALQSLKGSGYSLMAGSLDGEPFYDRPADAARTCLLIGNEGQGLTRETAAMADQKVRLPMPGEAESLNAAVACAVMAYDVLRRRLSP